jgi:drug/metabolite transporter (DMT)-like permease
MTARRATALLAAVVLAWPTRWASIKIGVMAMPPFWFARSRYLVAGLILVGGGIRLVMMEPRRERQTGRRAGGRSSRSRDRQRV